MNLLGKSAIDFYEMMLHPDLLCMELRDDFIKGTKTEINSDGILEIISKDLKCE